MRAKWMRATVAVVACALAVTGSMTGCAAGTPTIGSPGPSSTSGSGSGSGSHNITGHWQLVSGTDEKGAITPGDSVVTFTVNGASSGGHGPCNAFGATTHGGTTGAITIVLGIHTNLACIDPQLNTTEARYFAALNKVSRAALDNGTLTLTGGNDTLVFTKANQ